MSHLLNSNRLVIEYTCEEKNIKILIVYFAGVVNSQAKRRVRRSNQGTSVRVRVRPAVSQRQSPCTGTAGSAPPAAEG